jgi:thymidylate kinase
MFVSISSTPVQSGASPWAATILELIDNVIQDRVLVYGSLPPEGSDLDILARPAELSVIREALVVEGFVPMGKLLVRFRLGQCEMVELTPTDAWQLPPVELAALFAEAQTIVGTRRLAQPGAHHALLIRARKAVRRPQSLRRSHGRMATILRDEPDAGRDTWRRAEKRAAAWKARQALRLLKVASEREGHAPALLRWRAALEEYRGAAASGKRGARDLTHLLRAVLPRRPIPRFHRTQVVAFSGLDGSGKSSQARLLRDALRAMGQDAVVVWAGIGTNRSLRWVKAPIRRGMRALPRIGPLRELTERVAPKAHGAHTPLAEPGAHMRRHGAGFRLATSVWMTVMALVNAYTLRKALLRSFGRGRVVIFDRYTLDSAVRLQHWYGASGSARFVTWLMRLVNKRPLRAYFLDAPPQVVFARKPEWELHDLECRAALYDDGYMKLGVRRLDGTRPMNDLFAEIASDVWDALHQ